MAESSLALAEESEESHGSSIHHEISTETKVAFGAISSVLALLGVFLAYLAYVRKSIDVEAIAQKYNGAYKFLYNKWYFDEIYDAVIVRPLKSLSVFLWQAVDVGIIDGFLMAIVGGFGWLSSNLRKVQTGLVSNYALAIALGMVIIVGVYFAAFSDLFR